MKCTLTALLLTLGLLVTPAWADDDVPAPPKLTFDEIELLPLDDNERQLMHLENPQVFDTLFWLGNRRQKEARKLAKRKKQDDEKARNKRAELAKLDEQIGPLLVKAQAAILQREGITPEILVRIKRLKPALGPGREYRYAHSLVLDLAGLGEDRRGLLTRLVFGLEGAQLALQSEKKRLKKVAEQQGGQGVYRDQARQRMRDIDRQVRRMERRFWRLMDYLLDPAHKVALRTMLPHKLTRIQDPLGHALRLPGLTPSQAARLRALVAELEAEVTADRAEARKIQKEFQASGGKPWAERKPIRDRLRVVQLRMAHLLRRIKLEGRVILTPAQMTAFRAIPPFVSPRDRGLTIERLLRDFALGPEQRAKVRSLHARHAAARKESYAEHARVNMMSQNFGPDSPQMQAMNAMRMGIESRTTEVLHDATREVFTTVLTPQQVVGWVVAHGR